MLPNALKNAEVRDNLGGVEGQVVSTSPLKINWMSDPESVVPTTQTYDNSARTLNSVEIFLMSQGWVPIKQILQQTAAEAVDEAILCFEKKAHDPFRYKDNIGRGPRGDTNQKRSKKRWKCQKSGKYRQHCKKGDDEIEVEIDRAWKKDYNQEYYAKGFWHRTVGNRQSEDE